MLIIGTKGVKTTIGTGRFFCPHCESNQPFKHIKVTNFVSLYFLPIIPLSKLGDYIECSNCKETFVPEVLDYDTNENENVFLTEYEKAIQYCLVQIILADGNIDDQEMVIAWRTINKYSHHDISLLELKDYIDQIKDQPRDLDLYLKQVAFKMNVHGKEALLKSAIHVALADDDKFETSERVVIERMATIMEIRSKRVDELIAEVKKRVDSL